MAENSKIEWTMHTFNPWRGCTKVHEGCAHCYAESMSKRNPGTLGVWGPNGTRVVAAEAQWKLPLKWNREAEQAGERHRVFCASLADVFEDWNGAMLRHDGCSMWVCPECHKWRDGALPEVQNVHPYCYEHRATVPLMMSDIRRRLFSLIDSTPHLDWLLLTKRPENVRRMWPEFHLLNNGSNGGFAPGEITKRRLNNVWLGTSVSLQEHADKQIPELLKCRDLCPVLFLSMEPLLGPIDLNSVWPGGIPSPGSGSYVHGVDWVIVGGESGHGARPCRPEWIRQIVRQCKDVGVPVFAKQLGSNVVTRNDMVEDAFNDGHCGWPDPDVEYDIHGFREDYQGADCRIRLLDKKGGDWSEWPEDLRVREFPEVAAHAT